jgi:hypothetical protein
MTARVIPFQPAQLGNAGRHCDAGGNLDVLYVSGFWNISQYLQFIRVQASDVHALKRPQSPQPQYPLRKRWGN